MLDKDTGRSAADDPSEPNEDRVFSERELAKGNDDGSQSEGANTTATD
jgi:hypothetical protein